MNTDPDSNIEMSAAQQCFSNNIVVEKILENFSNPMKNIRWRLISRTFNTEIIRKIGKTYSSIELESLDSQKAHVKRVPYIVCLPSLPTFPTKVVINGCVMEASKVGTYFKLLNEVANVKIKEFRAINLSDLTVEARNQLHIDIAVFLRNHTLKVFTGMEDVCPIRCPDCSKHALECSEYGVQVGVLIVSIQQPRHFQRLNVSQAFLHRVASTSIRMSRTRQQCVDFIEQYINPRVTCDHLCLIITEKPTDDVQFKRHLPELLPCELLWEICRVWKVKTVGIQFDYCAKESQMGNIRRFSKFFTAIRLNDRVRDWNIRTNLKFDLVELDVRRSYQFSKDILENDSRVVANIKRLFPTENLLIHGNQSVEKPAGYFTVKQMLEDQRPSSFPIIQMNRPPLVGLHLFRTNSTPPCIAPRKLF